MTELHDKLFDRVFAMPREAPAADGARLPPPHVLAVYVRLRGIVGSSFFFYCRKSGVRERKAGILPVSPPLPRWSGRKMPLTF